MRPSTQPAAQPAAPSIHNVRRVAAEGPLAGKTVYPYGSGLGLNDPAGMGGLPGPRWLSFSAPSNSRMLTATRQPRHSTSLRSERQRGEQAQGRNGAGAASPDFALSPVAYADRITPGSRNLTRDQRCAFDGTNPLVARLHGRFSGEVLSYARSARPCRRPATPRHSCGGMWAAPQVGREVIDRATPNSRKSRRVIPCASPVARWSGCDRPSPDDEFRNHRAQASGARCSVAAGCPEAGG